MDQLPINHEAESVDKIRDILFGAQSRAMELRLTQLEEHYQTQQKNLRFEINKELESLRALIQTQSVEHQDAHVQAVTQLEKDFDERLHGSKMQVDTQLAEKQQEINQLKNELTQTKQDLQQVHDNSVKRDTLARLLGQLSKALSAPNASDTTRPPTQARVV
ncbi:MAG: hypothetical protein RLZZ502_1297 [Pseudomonadota bacterium]|jgi:2-oxoglutarate dehydrogenase complex dehydrogenase (E1) component-like enzyme